MADYGNPFGIDVNGNPTANTPGVNEYPNIGSTLVGSSNGCPTGQVSDGKGGCVPKETTGVVTPPTSPTVGGFVNTAPAAPSFTPSHPTGIPDPRYPGYDTAGFQLGSVYDPATGKTTIPNSTTGKTTTIGGAPVTPQNPFGITVTDTKPDPNQFLQQTSAGPAAPSSGPGNAYQFSPYTGPTFTPFQFAAPGKFDAGPTQPVTQNLIMEMLKNTALSPEVIAQMKESQKSTILGGADQLRQGILQDAARRGVSGGGETESTLAGLGESSLSDISRAYSGIDVSAAQADFANKQAAAAAAESFQNQLLQAFLGQQNLNLTTEEQQAAQNEKASAFGLQKYTTEEAFKNQASSSAFSQWLQAQGIDLDFLKNAQGNGLNIARFLANGQ